MNRASFRFYSELNDFLPPSRKFQAAAIEFDAGQSVKHLIEALNVPHPEVDLVLVNGVPVGFAYLAQDRDRVSVFPRFRTIALEPDTSLQPPAPAEYRFVLDGHLGRLAAYLRMMGFDTLYKSDYRDDELARISDSDRRILLTRDQELLKRARVSYGHWVRAIHPKHQLLEIVRHYDLAPLHPPFNRCLQCNGRLLLVPKQEIAPGLPEKTRRYYDRFKKCQVCDQIYWDGPHVTRMRQIIDWVMARGCKSP